MAGAIKGVALLLFLLLLILLGTGDEPDEGRLAAVRARGAEPGDMVMKTDEEWREILEPAQFRILRKKGTEPPFSHPYNELKAEGIFLCAACGNELFSSEHKFESGTGWPSFWAPVEGEHVAEEPDNSLLMRRTEVLCARCESHLGHVFEDGPRPTGLRYCINGLALQFEPGGEAAEDEG